MAIRLRRVDFEWYEPNMCEHEYYNAAGLSAYLLMLAREGFIYEVDNYDACVILADEDIELPSEVSDAYYEFLHDQDGDTKLYTHEGMQYLFERVRDTVE